MTLLELEPRETPSYIFSFKGNVRVGSVFDITGDYINLREYEYTPFVGHTGKLNTVYYEADDISVVAPAEFGGPRVQVRDGNHVYFDEFVYEEGFHGGVNVARGDVNGDSVSDIILGPNAGGGPRLKILDGTDYHVLFDDFVYDKSYRGGIEVGYYDGEVITLPKESGGPHLRIGDRSYLVGDSNSRSNRELIYGDLIGNKEFQIGVWEKGFLRVYSPDGLYMTGYQVPYTVTSVGVGGNYFSLNNRVLFSGYLNSAYVANNNGFELIEHDPILNTFIGSMPLYQPTTYLGSAFNKPGIFDNLVDHATPNSLYYPGKPPWRQNDRPLYAGSTIGEGGKTGTFTTLVYDKDTGVPYGLTNYHVANYDGTPKLVQSPGMADARAPYGPEMYIGETARSVGIDFDGPNFIDSTLFDLSLDNRLSKDVIVDTNRTISYNGSTEAYAGDLVYGFGRTTGPRPGVVQNNSYATDVQYPNGVASFIDQLYILSTQVPFSFASPGDSGSIVLKPYFLGDGVARWHMVGQVFAGNSLFGVASKWRHISDLLNVRL